LGELKAEVWNSFDGGVKMYEKIQNKPEIDRNVSKESIALTKVELNNIKGLALTFSDIVKNVAGAIGGIILNFKGNSSLDNARDISDNADEAIGKTDEGRNLIKKVKKLSENITIELKSLNKAYIVLLSSMENIVANKTNYRDFKYEERKALEKTMLSITLLKRLTMTNILDSKNNNSVLEESVNKTVSEVKIQREEKL
jgi:hypothetical protein